MFRGLFRQHTRTIINERGNSVTVPATCTEVNSLISSHVLLQPEDDGKGGLRMVREVVSCASVNEEFTRTVFANEQLTSQVERLTAEVETLTRERDNCNRLMAGALQVIFLMGPALQGLLSDDLGSPELTDDRSAVRLTGAAYTIVLDVFGEQIIVRPAIADQAVPEKIFEVPNGRLGENARTLLLGYITRIKAVAAGATDPVRGEIDLLAPAGAVE